MNVLIRLFFISIFTLVTFTVFAQKEANIWYFGNKAGLDFNSGSAVVINNGQLNSREGCATISDKNGDLLFYTEGTKVWNRNHEIMLNGTDLKGHYSSTNSAIIVPHPNEPSMYYIFTADHEGNESGFRYSKVDMLLDNGLGGIVEHEKNISMLSALISEKITAVNHSNNGYWVISHKIDSDEFIAFHISDSGIDLTPVISNVGSHIFKGAHAIGQIKVSPNEKK